jgi:SAM-dependent methyltransferase
MNHQDHVNLLRRAVPRDSGPWADFGSGDGAFTLALRDLTGPDTEIFSIEKNTARLDQQQRNFAIKFPQSNIHFLHADFTRPLDLPPLAGLVIANTLHFFRDQEKLLRQLRAYLKKEGRLVLVEYNTDLGNPWVPYPLSFETFRRLAVRAGFTEPELIATVPSGFLRQIYSALTFPI